LLYQVENCVTKDKGGIILHIFVADSYERYDQEVWAVLSGDLQTEVLEIRALCDTSWLSDYLASENVRMWFNKHS
jgi:hypothetical protein